jgi:hypothetical protein
LRRQRFSAFRLHVAGISGRLCGAARDSADRRPTLDAESPKRAKRAKRAKRVSKTGPVQNRNISGVPRGATKTFHVERLQSIDFQQLNTL